MCGRLREALAEGQRGTGSNDRGRGSRRVFHYGFDLSRLIRSFHTCRRVEASLIRKSPLLTSFIRCWSIELGTCSCYDYLGPQAELHGA